MDRQVNRWTQVDRQTADGLANGSVIESVNGNGVREGESTGRKK